MAVIRNLVSLLLVSMSYQAVTSASTLIRRGKDHDGGKGHDKSKDFSSSCGSTIASVSMNPDIQTCSNFVDLFPIHGAKKDFSKAIKEWISGVCAVQACTDQALAKAKDELSDGCKDELANDSPDAGALFSIFSFYKKIRTDSCQDTDKLDFCQPELLDSVENLKATNRTFFTISAEAYCEDCKKSVGGKSGGKPSKRSEKKSADVCSGSSLDKVSVTVGLPDLKAKSDAPGPKPKGPKPEAPKPDGPKPEAPGAKPKDPKPKVPESESDSQGPESDPGDIGTKE
ncbi:hypothetical protein MJO28_007763 [Puccinia striiformis f. sp. tritici]|uniref:Uncharacterized protein n=3 Tax=Puccinia striiformis TaxID=27350 RepID=A0A0L0V3Q8_9BASI|nr:hypothetical protein Pst134EA_013871 [Puccinia striiformis f. sp. tritici]KNE93945.1 hypothetical protein PSTG_12744 [Puccinia striiformis f. sp. tritici PST-78]POW09794.1 hypothetical protein PSTT_06631 [Puccinia striiformis]KAH9454753.1 hypothetical protein Pst134EB_014818 [Puccinia striiformis f. sp. tritici]KAH9466018.1 hypothetical protein Pst134EA_013871 [Puccinia striiformis f. sp. tritici]KAI7952079.1 hypothetical protein MJO28_007763 [Puccinia striiformis f. sp. tritici]